MKKIVLLWVWVFLLGGGVSAWAQENAGDGEKTAFHSQTLHWGKDLGDIVNYRYRCTCRHAEQCQHLCESFRRAIGIVYHNSFAIFAENTRKYLYITYKYKE